MSGSTHNRDGQIRTQWCHGAPGIVATLAPFLDEELAVAGGELTWRAGPLRKGANLCHGTAGNGYAFLALLERTGDERWLTRARAFAMHAARQVEQSRSEYGRGRYTLWTGDLGTALYLADCIDGGGQVPSLVLLPMSFADSAGLEWRSSSDKGGGCGDGSRFVAEANIQAITLFVEDLDAAKRFYGEVFGLPIAYEDDASAVFTSGTR